MSKRVLSIVALALAGTVVHAGNLSAATPPVVVGSATCQAAFTHYATIQQAVDAVGSGGTVLVCPGIYPEQITISRPVTVQGIVDGVHGLVRITVPAGGFLPSASMEDFGIVAAQVTAQNTTGVNLSDLTIDGTGIPCATAVGLDHDAPPN